METITHPHLTHEGGIWRIALLEAWTPIANRYIPLKIKKLQALDQKILNNIRQEYEYFRSYPDACITTTSKYAFAVRSPYIPGSRTQDIYTVQYVRALLAAWHGFSYHNWYEHTPQGTNLGRVCDGPRSCKNPRHYAMGQRRKRKLEYEFAETDESEAFISRDISDWIDLLSTVDSMVAEGQAAEDPEDKIIAQVESQMKDIWGDRPIPATETYTSMRDVILTALGKGKPITKVVPSSMRVTDQKILRDLSPSREDIQASLEKLKKGEK